MTKIYICGLFCYSVIVSKINIYPVKQIHRPLLRKVNSALDPCKRRILHLIQDYILIQQAKVLHICLEDLVPLVFF